MTRKKRSKRAARSPHPRRNTTSERAAPARERETGASSPLAARSTTNASPSAASRRTGEAAPLRRTGQVAPLAPPDGAPHGSGARRRTGQAASLVPDLDGDLAREAREQSVAIEPIAESGAASHREGGSSRRARTVPPRPPPLRRAKSATVQLDPHDDAVIAELAVGAVRGIELVEQVIAKLEANGGRLGGRGVPEHPARGLDPKELDVLAFPGDRPVPSSVRRFLAYDETYLGIVDGHPPTLRFQSFQSLVAAVRPELAPRYANHARLLPGSCLHLLDHGDACCFLYAGEHDESSEYPVFALHADRVKLAYPGFDVYLAELLLGPGWSVRHTKAIEEQARRNFRGLVTFHLRS